MNPQTFEQISVPLKVIDGDEFLKEGNTYSISFLSEEPLSVMLRQKLI